MYIKKNLFADGFNLDWIITAANRFVLMQVINQGLWEFCIDHLFFS